MRTRRNAGPPTPPERRAGGRSRGSHARGPERSPAKPVVPRFSAPGFRTLRAAAPEPIAHSPITSGSGASRPFPSGPFTTGRAAPRLETTGTRSASSGLTLRSAGAWRPRTVRAKVVALLMVPIVSLMALWGLAAVSTAQSVWSLMQLRAVNTDVREPIDIAISSLQQERSAAMRALSAPGDSADQAGYQAAFGSTDGANTQISTGAQSAAAALAYLGSNTQQRITALLNALDSLGPLRREVEQGKVGVSSAYSSYCATIDDAFAVDSSLATLQDDAVGSNAQSVLQLAQAGEMLARQDSVLSAAYTAGSVSQADYQEFVGAAYTENILQLDATRALRPTDLAAYQQVVGSASYLQLRREQTAVLAAGPGPVTATGFSGTGWGKSEQSVVTGLDAVATAAGTAAVDQIDPYTSVLTNPQGIAVVVGFAAVLLSLLVSVQVGRRLVFELVGLRDTALDLARRRLPQAIARLRAGQEVDLDLEAPPAVRAQDEIGQVSEALAAAARAAIQAAVERAEVVSAVAGVFLNLARRSQLLVHRQLALLDTMERRNDDPDELEDLFRLDHLATRMRRHAEGLIILSGAAPGRGWRKPVPLMDVLRAAVAEVEDYARVDVRRVDMVHLVGGAVADLTHLLAELVENATAFSPPHTRVQVRGEQVGTGFAIDIEDRGLGMGEQAIADANRRIANAAQADLFDSDRLGLFVVSRLSRRHDIEVTLGRSAYGGTTAVVLLPKSLLENTAAGSFSQAEADGFNRAGTDESGPVVETEPGDGHDGPSGVDGGRQPGPEPILIRVPSQISPEHEVERAPEPPLGQRPGQARPEPATNGFHRLNGHYPTTDSGADPAATRSAAQFGASKSEAANGSLPRRVRQASLAPQLKADPSNRAESADYVPPQASATVSPERARATMSAFQDGWTRGRSVHGMAGIESDVESGPEPRPGPAANPATDDSPSGGGPAAPTRAKESQ
jgi:signal transduction histidine kinase